jgi:hypothetical protein
MNAIHGSGRPSRQADDLAELIEALRSARAPCEPLFTTLGRRLEETIQVVGEMGSRLEIVATTMESDSWRDAVQVLRDGGSRISALADVFAAERSGLAMIGDATARIVGSVERLKAIIAEVRALGVNAKIEAAQLSVSGLDFTVFTSSIGRLATLAEEGLSGLAGQLTGVETLVSNAAAEGATFERDHRQDLLEVGKRLDSALAAVSDQQRQVAAAMAAVGRRSQNVGKSVADAVVALQINDITRQRFEHIEQALQATQEIAVAAEDNSIGQDDSRRMLAAVCRLQATQLAKANQAFEHEVERLVASLRALAQEVQAIRQESALLHGHDLAGGDSLVGRLGGELSAVRALLDSYGKASGGLQRLVGTVSRSASEMGRYIETVQSIDADMRVMGLNATFKCGRLGNEGRALSVIAQQLRSCAGRTEELAKSLGQGLNGMVDAAQPLVGGGHLDGTGNQAGIEELMTSMTRSAATLGEIGQEFVERLSAIDAAGDRAALLLGHAVDEIATRQPLHAATERVLARLDSLGGSADLGGQGIDESMEKRIFAMLRGRYTMASERDVHAMLTGEAARASASPTTAETASNEDDLGDILF